MIEKILDSFGSLFELHGATTLNEDCSTHVAEGCTVVDEVLNIVKTAHIHRMLLGVGHTPCLECLAELLAHKHNHIKLDARSEEVVEDVAMFLLRLVAQFAHIAKDDALVRSIVHFE